MISTRSFHLAQLKLAGKQPEGVVHGGFHIMPLPNDVSAEEIEWRLHLVTTRYIEWEIDREYALTIELMEGPVFEVSGTLIASDEKAHEFSGIGIPEECRKTVFRFADDG